MSRTRDALDERGLVAIAATASKRVVRYGCSIDVRSICCGSTVPLELGAGSAASAREFIASPTRASARFIIIANAVKAGGRIKHAGHPSMFPYRSTQW
ncbi:MAG TPA: hypothetical protein VMM36_18245 [Opitutaceae bacterium]|nr:hypothetical protein [Opitutaceae bacterium]